MNIEQAKKFPIEEVLAAMGYFPVRKDKGGVELVYNSPFREEKIPSMFANIKKNVWNDFGDRGGDVIDFVMHHENTNVSGALAFLSRMNLKTDFKAHRAANQKITDSTSQKTETLILDNILPLKSAILEDYLRSRQVNVSIARKYLKVVQFHHSKKGTKYFGLGFENQSGDFDVRNPKMKAVVGSKDISFIKGETSIDVTVFEGFMDFLSYLTFKNRSSLSSDVIVLNSDKLKERAKDFIKKGNYQKIYTFFDNDIAGEKTNESFAELKNKIIPCNQMYEGFKDFNEYWQSKAKTEIKR